VHLYLIVLPWANPSPNPKRHLDRFSRFCTARDRESLNVTTDRPSSLLKFPFAIGDLDPHLIHRVLAPHKSSTQTVSLSVQPLPHTSPQSVPIGLLYNGPPFPPQNCPLAWERELDPHLIHRPTRVLKENGISIGSTVFAGLTTVTDRQTATPSVTIYVVLRCGLKINA